MSRSLFLGLIVLVLVVVAVVVWKSGALGGPGSSGVVEHAEEEDGPAAPPRLHGVEGAVAPPLPGSCTGSTRSERGAARTMVGGQVVDEHGDPVPLAAVFLVAKDRPDDASDAAEQKTPTDEQGRFTLPDAALAGRWLGVRAHGYLVTHADGDAVEDADDLRIVLRRGPEIRVRVEGFDGGPLDLDTILLVETPEGTGRVWPLPGEPIALDREVVVTAHTQDERFTVGTEGALTVHALYGSTDYLVEPEDPVEVRGGESIVFRITPSCTLSLRVFEAATGDPLPRGFSFETFRNGESLSGGCTSLPGGVLENRWRNRPGTFAVRVMATGYLPQETEPVHLENPGDTATFEVHLRRDPTQGSLRISIPLLAELPRRKTPGGDTAAAVPFFRWKRPLALGSKYERENAKHWTWGTLEGEVRRESDTDYLFEGIPEGEVTLLVGEVLTDRVAIVPGIRVTGGRTDTTTVGLGLGFRFDPRSLIPRGKTCRSFRIRHPRYGELPAWSYRPRESEYYEIGEVPDLEHSLGPYPGLELTVEIECEDGTRIGKTVRQDR